MDGSVEIREVDVGKCSEGETIRARRDKSEKGFKVAFVKPVKDLRMPDQNEGKINVVMLVFPFRSLQGINQLAAAALVEIRLPGVFAKKQVTHLRERRARPGFAAPLLGVGIVWMEASL